MKNALSTTFLQQILCGRLLLAVISGQKNSFSDEFKLKHVTTYYLLLLAVIGG